MRQIITFLMVYFALGAIAQTQPNLPVGSKLFSGSMYEDPDGLLWSGKAGKYVCIGSKTDYNALIKAGYTKIQVDSIAVEVRKRSTHTGTQAMTTIDGLQDALENTPITSASYTMLQTIYQTTDFARDGSKLVQLGDFLFLLGGWNPAETPVTNSEVYRFNKGVTATTKLADAPWSGRHTFGCVVDKDSVYVLGGDLITGSYQKDVWKGVLVGDIIQWSELTSNAPWGERVLFGSVIHNGNIYIIGGQKGFNASDGLLTDVWKSKDGIAWEQVTTEAPAAAVGKNITGGCVSFNGYIYIIGGGVYDTPTTNGTYGNEIWRSKDGIIWEQLDNAPWNGRQYNDCAVWDGKIVSIGGNIGGNIPTDNTIDMWLMDIKHDWVKIDDAGYNGRHATAVSTYNSKLVISTGNMWNDTWVVDRIKASSMSIPNTGVVRDKNGIINNNVINVAAGNIGGYIVGATTEIPNGVASMFYSQDILRIYSNGKIWLYDDASSPSALPSVRIENGKIGIGASPTLADLQVSGSLSAQEYYVENFKSAPSSPTDVGIQGEIRITPEAIYICISANIWVRATLSTW